MKRDFLLGGTKLPTGGAVRGAGGAMSPPVFMLKEALEKIHETNPLHDRDVWVNGFFQEVPPTTIVSEDGSLGFVSKSH